MLLALPEPGLFHLDLLRELLELGVVELLDLEFTVVDGKFRIGVLRSY
jgi:hypothetical protein